MGTPSTQIVEQEGFTQRRLGYTQRNAQLSAISRLEGVRPSQYASTDGHGARDRVENSMAGGATERLSKLPSARERSRA